MQWAEPPEVRQLGESRARAQDGRMRNPRVYM